MLEQSRGLISGRAGLFFIVSAFLMIFHAGPVYADCTSPSAPNGAKEWFGGGPTTACEDSGGVVVGGYCWLTGIGGESCDDVCGDTGSTCNLTGVRNYAGSSGSDANCQAVLDALPYTGNGAVTSGSGYSYGCGFFPSLGGIRIRNTSTTTCEGSTPVAFRACACNLNMTPGSGAGSLSSYKFCLNDAWVDVGDGGVLGGCSNAGAWEWDSAEEAFKHCDGTNWRKAGCSAGGGPLGQTCSGGLALVGTPVTSGAYALYHNGTYLYRSTGFAHGLSAYSFNGSTFTSRGSFDIGSDVYSIYADGNYVFAAFQSGVRALSHNGSSFTSLATLSVTTTGALWGDGTYLYVPLEGALRAYTFNGSSFTLRGTYTISGERPIYMWQDGTYLYVVFNNVDDSGYHIRVLSFNGTSFTERTNAGTRLMDSSSIIGDQNYLYVSGASGLSAYTFNGTSFTQVGNSYTGIYGGLIHADNGVLISGANYHSSYVLTVYHTNHIINFDGTDFSLQAAYDYTGSTLGFKQTVYDGTYIYNGLSNYGTDNQGHIYALSHTVSCVANGCGSLGSCSTPGQIEFNSGNNRIQFCDGAGLFAVDANSVGGGGSGTDTTNPVWTTPAAGTEIINAKLNTSALAYVTATDNSGTVYYSKVSDSGIGDAYLSVGASDGSVALYTGLVSGLSTGTYSVVVRASDPDGNYVDRSFNITLTAADPIKVLCTYYHSRGMIAENLMDGDLAYAEMVDPQVGRAYRAWANPLIVYLKEHEGSWIDRFMYVMVKAWAQEMAYRTGYAEDGSLLGWLISEIGEPLHYAAGYFVPEDDFERELRERYEQMQDQTIAAYQPSVQP